MTKDEVMRSIVVEHIYPILMNSDKDIPFPLLFNHNDKVTYLDHIIKYLEKFEEYSKCSDVLKIRNSLQKKYEQSSNNQRSKEG
jgi:hypothetical protein